MPQFLFVGERPSPKAARMGVTWEHGRLAAKQLFDALFAVGLDPKSHRFDNVFVPTPEGPEVVCRNAVRRIKRAAISGLRVVAMGKKVEAVMAAKCIPCLSIVHPAARGRIRKKERYAEHVREVLNEAERHTSA